MKKTHKIFIFVGVIVTMILFVWWYLTPSSAANEETAESILVDVPEADTSDLKESKSEAYQEAAGTNRHSYDDYFDSLIGDDGKLVGDADISLVSNDSKNAGKNSAPSGRDRIDEVLGVQPQSIPAAAPSVKAPSQKRTSSTDDKYVQDMERARAIATAMGMTEEAPSRSEEGENGAKESGIPPRKSSGIISSLDDIYEDYSDFPEESPVVRCMIMRDEKVKNGQRITIRTLEEFIENGYLIPANTHLTASCQISERLALKIASVELNGRIIPLNYEAYDYDGSYGIYCPETTSSKGSKQVANQAVSTGSALLGGRVGVIANAVVRTGATLLQNSTGETCVSISNGYEFFIMRKER